MYYNVKKVSAFNSVLLENWKKAKIFAMHTLFKSQKPDFAYRKGPTEYNLKRETLQQEKGEEKNQRGYPCSSREWSCLETVPTCTHTLPFSHCPCPGTVNIHPPGPDFTSYSSEIMIVVDFLSICS